MTCQVRRATRDDESIWDAYVSTHPHASPYHKFAWVKSVEQAYQHTNASLIALQDDVVVGLLPCIEMRRPFLGKHFCSLPFCDVGYAIADNQLVVSQLIEHARGYLLSSDRESLDYRDTDINNQPHVPVDLAGRKVRMMLSLPETSDALFSSFKSKLRSQIRKSEKNGLRYELFSDSSAILDFYSIFALNMRKLGSPVHSRVWFERIIENYQQNSLLSVVYSENTPIGAAITLSNGSATAIPWASTVAQYNKLAPNMLLYWSVLKAACDNNMTTFDFGRSTFDEGTYRFKAQWGAQAQGLNWYNLTQQTDNAGPSRESEQAKTGRLRPIVEKVWSELPLGVTTYLGPKIRKHISL